MRLTQGQSFKYATIIPMFPHYLTVFIVKTFNSFGWRWGLSFAFRVSLGGFPFISCTGDITGYKK